MAAVHVRLTGNTVPVWLVRSQCDRHGRQAPEKHTQREKERNDEVMKRDIKML